MQPLKSTLLTIALAAALPVSAQTMKPGLWEVATQIQSANGQVEQAMAMAQQQMKTMSPEQRKMMNDMMAKNGVSLSGNGVTAKVCITKEMAARNDAPIQTQNGCTSTHSPIVNGKMKVTYSCAQPKSSGEGELTFEGDKAYRMTMRSTGVQGATGEMTMSGNGRWLGSDCGSIKPVTR